MSDDVMADGDGDLVLIGLLEKPQTQQALCSNRFPSKAGGFPVWLNPLNLPQPEDLRCGRCELPLRFIAQIYSPIDDDEQAFHRTLFVFCCQDGACGDSPDSVRVFRSQLPRVNPFYSSVAIDASFDIPGIPHALTYDTQATAHPEAPLCQVCGSSGPKSCQRCRRANYCHQWHQKIHWGAGGHSKQCNLDHNENVVSVPNTFVYPEWEIVIEDEDEHDALDSFKDRAKVLVDQYESELNTMTEDDKIDHNELEFNRTVIELDDQFVRFQDRIGRHPGQCIRYDRGGVPLWTHSDGQFNQERTELTCPHCHGPVEFELQILPQILSFLEVDRDASMHSNNTMDFGTIAVFTCQASCGSGIDQYYREHAWRQSPPAPM